MMRLFFYVDSGAVDCSVGVVHVLNCKGVFLTSTAHFFIGPIIMPTDPIVGKVTLTKNATETTVANGNWLLCLRQSMLWHGLSVPLCRSFPPLGQHRVYCATCKSRNHIGKLCLCHTRLRDAARAVELTGTIPRTISNRVAFWRLFY
jgi:hypothetical protein